MKTTTTCFFIMSIIMILVSCSQDGVSPIADSQEIVINDFLSKGPPKNNDLSATSDDGTYTESASCLVKYIRKSDSYNSASLKTWSGSYLYIDYNSLIPPEELQGKTVTITMLMEKDLVNNELIYTFGPNGCEFSTPAQLWLSWKDLGSVNATLYYLDEDGNRVEHLPDDVDLYDQKMLINIDHFSRYAVAYSN
jgi:hypothetical protein